MKTIEIKYILPKNLKKFWIQIFALLIREIILLQPLFEILFVVLHYIANLVTVWIETKNILQHKLIRACNCQIVRFST